MKRKVTKVGDKSPGSNAGKAKQNTVKNKKQKTTGKKVDNVSKAIKKSPTKSKAKRIKKAVETALNNSQQLTPKTPKTPKSKSPQKNTVKGSPKKMSPRSSSITKAPRSTKNKLPKTPIQATVNGNASPKKKNKKLSKVKPITPKTPKKAQKPGKSLTSKKALSTSKTPAKSKLATSKASRTTPKFLNKQHSSPKTSPSKKSLRHSKVPSPEKSGTKINPPKLNQKSVVIKRAPKKTIKRKIKIAGLIGKKPSKPEVTNTNGGATESSTTPMTSTPHSTPNLRKNAKKVSKLAVVLAPLSGKVTKKKTKSRGRPNANTPLREKMMDRLQSARFRYLNEELYTKDSAGAVKLFEEDPDAFAAYHEGYRQQVKKWPMNPLTKIISTIKKMNEKYIVADFGCGDAELAKSVKQKVHSFDLVAANKAVTACDMAHVPLAKNSVDIAVFCLSLMGTNLQDYLLEANRVLKVGGILMVAEVESRFDKVETFLTGLNRFGFSNIHKDFDHNLFYLMHFCKDRDIKNKKNLPTLSLHPCIYKKR